MGTFVGHVVPGTLFLSYGLCLYLYSIVLSNILSNQDTQSLVSPKEYEKKSSIKSNRLTPLTRLMLNRRVACIGYGMALTLALIAGPIVELVQWDGSWHHMTSPQHASMYGLVIMSSVIGLLTATNYLTNHSRWVVSMAFIISGFMFYSHAQHDLFSTVIHQIVAYLLWLIGAVWLLHNVLTTACEVAVNQASYTNASTWLVSPTLSTCTVITGRMTGFMLILAGAWMWHIAFALYSPFVDGDIHHHDHDAHLLFMELSWYILGVAAFGAVIEVGLRLCEDNKLFCSTEYVKLTSTEEGEEVSNAAIGITIKDIHAMKSNRFTVDDEGVPSKV